MDRGPVRANDRKRGDLTSRFPAPRAAGSGDPGTVGEDVLLAMAGIGAGQGTERQEPRKVDDILIVGRPGSQSSVLLPSGTGQT